MFSVPLREVVSVATIVAAGLTYLAVKERRSHPAATTAMLAVTLVGSVVVFRPTLRQGVALSGAFALAAGSAGLATYVRRNRTHEESTR